MRPVLLALLLACPLLAWDPPTRTEWALEGANLALMVVDWGQTLDLTNYSGRAYEQNPLLPRYPTRAQVNRHFIIGMGLHYLTFRALPHKFRTPFLIGTLTLQVACVNHNYRVGLRVTF